MNDASKEITAQTTTDVLIVGAGPVGLGLALELAWRGVRCTIIDQGDGVITAPKLGAIGIRTMEFARRWGIAERIRGTPFRRDYKLDMVFATSMAGHFLARHEYPSLADDAPPPESPEQKWRCPQLWFDPLLTQCVREHSSATLLHRRRLEGFEQDGEQVTANVTDLATGRRERIVARYMVGCDGAGSTVRRQLGIEMEGRRALDYSAAVFFRSAALTAAHDKGEAERYLFFGAKGFWGNISAMNGQDLWRLTVVSNEAEVDQVCVDAADWVRRGIGRDDVPFEVISALAWRRSQLTATRYHEGRVFIAGDAAHTMSPTGGFGMNTGMGDIVDLGWKLQAMLDGWGGEKLLESYGVERRPVGERNVNASAHNYFALKSVQDASRIDEPGPGGDAVRRQVGEAIAQATHTEWETLGIHLGYRYEGSPIIVPDGTPADEDSPRYYRPTTRPGHRAPHAWLPDGRSTLDLYGRGFALMRLGPQAPDTGAFRQAAASRGVPLQVHDIESPEVASLYERRLVLVRPDGHVAWRGDALPADAGHVLDVARGASA